MCLETLRTCLETLPVIKNTGKKGIPLALKVSNCAACAFQIFMLISPKTNTRASLTGHMSSPVCTKSFEKLSLSFQLLVILVMHPIFLSLYFCTEKQFR